MANAISKISWKKGTSSEKKLYASKIFYFMMRDIKKLKTKKLKLKNIARIKTKKNTKRRKQFLKENCQPNFSKNIHSENSEGLFIISNLTWPISFQYENKLSY